MSRLQAISLTTRSEIIRFCSDENGATAIEYSVVAAGVGLTVSTTVWNLGGKLKSTFYDKLASLLP
jgi:Flp pilus assembly pilin Flp